MAAPGRNVDEHKAGWDFGIKGVQRRDGGGGGISSWATT